MIGEETLAKRSGRDLADAHIVLALELGPELLRLQDHDWPNDPSMDHALASDTFWKAFLADSGIVNVTAIALGEWQVAAADLEDATLEILLHAHLFRWQNDDEEGQEVMSPEKTEISQLDLNLFGALNGGFYWIEGNDMIFKPQCCGDLGNYANWIDAMNLQPGEHASIWVGHPSIPCRRVQDTLEFADHKDWTGELPDEAYRFEIKLLAFQSILDEMAAQMAAFQARLLALLQAMKAPDPKGLTEQLSGVNMIGNDFLSPKTRR